MNSSIASIAKFTIIESLRNRNLVFMLVGLAVLLGAAEFIAELAVTESMEMSLAWLAFSARLFLVVLLSLFVLTSLAREFEDKVALHILSHAIKRHSYYFGKLLAFAVIALISVIVLSIFLLFYASFTEVVLWSISLFLELLLVVALSLLFFFTFKQTVISFVSIMAFYLLARNMATIQLISDSPIIESTSWSHRFMNWVLDAIEYILPAIHEFAQTGWLIYQQGSVQDLIMNGVQCLIYVALISMAALFDLYRMEF